MLILHSFGRDFAPFGAIAQEFRAELRRQSLEPIEFLDASLEMARFDGVENEGPLVDFLSAAYRGREPNLVAAVGAPAAHFCLRNAERLFATVPLLILGSDKRRIAGLVEDSRTASVHFDLDLRALALNVLQVRPETRHLYVVFGTAPVERFWEPECRRVWEPLLPGVEFHWLSDRSLARMAEELAATPPNAAIFFGILSRDAAGVPHEHDAALQRLHAAANAPIFGFSEEQLGLGIVGGPLVSMRQVGREAAAVALRIFDGESPGRIEVPAVVLGQPVYDWRELERWGIERSFLPEGSSVRFRPTGLWEAHRTAVILGSGVLVLQGVLIVLLLAARRRARESEASLRLATEAASVGLWHRGASENDEIHASALWRTLFGLPEHARIQTEDVLARIHPEDRESVRQSLEQAGREGRQFEIEHRIETPDGTVRWIASRGQAEGERTRGVSMDISKRKQAEAQLASQRNELAHLARVSSLGVLSGALAHELNQPLGIILSNAQAAQHLLAEEQPDLVELREILADIVSEDRRAGDVIKRLRALLQRGETTRRPLDVNGCLGEVLRLLRSELVARGVTVQCELAANPPQVVADRVQLQQILLNLIANACDAMEANPRNKRILTLGTFADGGECRVVVRDCGIGLPADPEVMFKPFHTTKANGLGMGLAICRMLAEAHGGRLLAESNPGRGATFHLALPAANDAP